MLSFLGNGCVARNHCRSHSASGLYSERERSNVKQEHVFHVPLKNTALDGSTDGDYFVWIDAFVRVFPSKILSRFIDHRHAGHATNKNEFVNLRSAELGLLQTLDHRSLRSLEEFVAHLLQLGASECLLNVLGAACIGCDERKIYLVSLSRRKSNLGFLGLFFYSL